MLCRAKRLSITSFAGFGIQLLMLPMVGPAALAATVPAESSPGDKSRPQLSVRVYGFARLSPWLLQTSEIQAARLLGNVPIDLNWVNCTSRSLSTACTSDL